MDRATGICESYQEGEEGGEEQWVLQGYQLSRS